MRNTPEVSPGNGGWWATLTGHGYPLGAWRRDSGPWPTRWMAQWLSFPLARWQDPNADLEKREDTNAK